MFLIAAGRFTMTRSQRSRPCPVVITGAALGLPGTEHIFDDGNIEPHPARRSIHRYDSPAASAQAMLDKHITRLVKSENGGPTFESIDNVGGCDQAGRHAEAPSICRMSSAFRPIAWPRSTA